MSVAVIDAGIAIGWIQGRHRAGAKLERLFGAGRDGQTDLVISVVKARRYYSDRRDHEKG